MPKKERKLIMTIITSAEKLPVRSIEMTKNVKLTHATTNMRRQKLLGIALTAICTGAVFFVQGVEILLLLIPLGIYLIFTKKTVLEFEDE